MSRAWSKWLAIGAATAAGLSFGYGGAPAHRDPEEPPQPTTRHLTESKAIPYGGRVVEVSGLAPGERRVVLHGIPGERTVTYHVVLMDGREISREPVQSEKTRSPVDQLIAVGAGADPPAVQNPDSAFQWSPPSGGSGCHPNYSGCVPVASDVDCAGGSGNGPAYTGYVRIIGPDVYGLDADGDGYGCES